MKYVAVRILEQWKNLEVYFLQFLPKQSNFRSSVANTDRYKRISEALRDPLTEAYVSFCAYSATEFEDFLLSFQSDEPKIHLLYPSMCKLVSILMRKLASKKLLSDADAEKLLVDIHLKENRKPLKFIEVGTKATGILYEQEQL